MAEAHAILVMREITKEFPGVRALEDVCFEVGRGEAHALVGENGAGKSTLMKILAGAVGCDRGEIALDGRPVQITSPLRAQELGISMIYQDFNLVGPMTVAENIFLGREPSLGLGVVDRGRLQRDAEAILRRLGVGLDPRTPVSRMMVGRPLTAKIPKQPARARGGRPRGERGVRACRCGAPGGEGKPRALAEVGLVGSATAAGRPLWARPPQRCTRFSKLTRASPRWSARSRRWTMGRC